MTLDMRRLTSIMRMTESASDGEALNALRMANRLLKSEGKHWGDVIGFAPPPPVVPKGYGSASSFRTPPSKRGPRGYGQAAPRQRYDPDKGRNHGKDCEEMLHNLGTMKLDMSTMMFVASLNDHWERKGYLTDAQYDALKRMDKGGRL